MHAWVRPIINALPCGLVSEVHSAFFRAVDLQSSDYRRTPSATGRMLDMEEKKHNIRFSELWRIFLLFSRQLSSWFDLDILLKVVKAFKLCCSLVWDSSHCRSSSERRQSHVMSKAIITIAYYKAFGLTVSPLFGAACIDQASWRVLNKLRCERLPNKEALQWTILSTQSLLR